MVGCHHRRNGHVFEQTLGVGDRQGSLAYCSPWGHKESDMMERLNRSKSIQSCLTVTLWTVACQAPMSMWVLQARMVE